MATIFETWYDDVLPYVNGCPFPVAKQKIRQAAIDFCKRSGAWRYLGMTPINSGAGQQTYVLSAAVGGVPAGTVVAHVYQVNYLNVPLRARTPAQFKAMSDTWYSDTGTPEVFTLIAEGELSLYRIPTAVAVGAIRIPEVSLAPSQASADIDDRIYEKYRDAIATGARALIHSIPKKPYSDLNLGHALMQDFNAMVGGAAARTASGRGTARLRTATLPRG